MRFAQRALLVIALAAHSTQTLADVPEGEEPGEPRVVILDATGGEGIDAEFQATLAELLARFELVVVRSADARGGRIVAHVHVESSERGAVLTVESRRPGFSPIRREIERGESLSLFRETLAHVILGAIEPLAAQDDATVAPPAPEQPPSLPTIPAADRPSPPRPRLIVGARTGARLLESDRLGMGAAGTASVMLDGPLRPFAGLHAEYVLPAQVSANGVGGQFRLVPLRLEMGLEPIAWSRIALQALAVGGVDWASFTPKEAAPFVQLAATSRRVQPIVGAALAGRLRVSSSVDLVLVTGLDLDLAPRRWVIASPDGRDPLFEMARLRPYLALGLDWTMLGGPSVSASEGAP